MPSTDTTARDAERAVGRDQVAALKAARDEAQLRSTEDHEYADALMWHQIGELIRDKTIRQSDAVEVTGYSRDRVLKQTTRYRELPAPPRAADRTRAAVPDVDTAVLITSFGFRHGEAPAADLVVDLRRYFPFPYPGAQPADSAVLDEAVRTTPGVAQLVAATAGTALVYRAAPAADGRPVRIAPGCTEGRYAAAFARVLRDALAALGTSAQDLDLDEPAAENP
ncbi:RapZ C-terminal domain-containing protein [Kitasatospora griseola]|uniref:RapZ C-terminal domain-containing protein n=1 Tax=Kitasatospora griseola TaxID=2064 RepID=UPI00341E5BD3